MRIDVAVLIALQNSSLRLSIAYTIVQERYTPDAGSESVENPKIKRALVWGSLSARRDVD